MLVTALYKSLTTTRTACSSIQPHDWQLKQIGFGEPDYLKACSLSQLNQKTETAGFFAAHHLQPVQLRAVFIWPSTPKCMKTLEQPSIARKRHISVKNNKIFQCIDMKVFVCRTSLEDSSHSTPSPLSSAASSQARHPQIKMGLPFEIENPPAKARLNWVKLTPGLPPHCPAAGTRASCCSCSRGKEERTQVFSWKVLISISIYWKVNFSY